MIADGWTFINDAGIAVDDISVAWEINRRIKQHQTEQEEHE